MFGSRETAARSLMTLFGKPGAGLSSPCTCSLLTDYCLLPRHDHAHLGFAVCDHIAADVECHAVDRAGEFKGRLVEGRDRCAGICADGDASRQPQAERRGVREIRLADKLAVDVELAAARGALAMGEVRRTGHFEFEAQLVMPGRDRDRALDTQVVTGYIVVDVLQPVVLDVEA